MGTRSVHEIQLEEVLAHLKLLDHDPEVEFYGIEPQEIGFSTDLSPQVALQIPRLAEHLRELLARTISAAPA